MDTEQEREFFTIRTEVEILRRAYSFAKSNLREAEDRLARLERRRDSSVSEGSADTRKQLNG